MTSPIAFSAAGTGPATGDGSGGARPKLEHAFLELRTPPTGGGLTPGPPCGRVDFQFNPKELTLTKAASWKRTPAKGAKSAGPPEYQGPQPSKLKMEVFFDASDTQDTSVVKAVEQLFACCVPTGETRQQKKASPPWVVFHWGGLTGFPAYVSQVQAKYTLFTTSGVPIRAVCQVSLEEISGETPGQNPTSGALAAQRVHRLRSGDTLQAVAYAEYGDPAAWRAIAELNGIDDPMRLVAGREIMLPDPDRLGRSDGDRARGR